MPQDSLAIAVVSAACMPNGAAALFGNSMAECRILDDKTIFSQEDSGAKLLNVVIPKA